MKHFQIARQAVLILAMGALASCGGGGGSSQNEPTAPSDSVVPADVTAPSPPNGLQVSSLTVNSATLVWNASTDNVAVTGYRIMRSDNSAAAVEIGDITALIFVDTAVSTAGNYLYQVFAYDAAGNETGGSSLPVAIPAGITATNDSYSTPYQTVLNGNISVNDTQSTNMPNSWELVSQALNGTTNIDSSGTFTYTPSSGYSGNDNFTYQIRDSLNNTSNVASVTVSVQPQQVTGACDVLYANNGGFAPVTSQSVMPIPNIAKPVKGNHYLDPDFGTCVVRVTDNASDSNTIVNRVVPVYSRRQIFNADQTQLLLLASDGFWHLYDASDYSHIRRVDLQGDNVEVQWHPTDPDLLYRVAYNGGRQIYLHDISDPTDTTVSVAADFTSVNSINSYPGFNNINQVWPNATRFLTGEEGSPSSDGRYWALMAMSNDFNTSYGMIVYDLQTDTIVGLYDYATDGGGIGGPNNVTMSPSGSYVVALWNPPACQAGLGTLNSPCGTMAFNRDFSTATGLTINGEHGDTATDINGRDVYVGIEYQDRGAIEIIDLQTGSLIADIETQVWVGGAVHISGRAYDKPGWVVISHYVGSAINTWYNEEVFLAKLDSTPVMVSLAKHQSDSSNYWSQPHATISRDATRVVWGSNWGGSVLDLDTYMVTLPVNALDNL